MGIVAVTTCASGIAHTYIVEEKLVQAAEDMGHTTHMEAQETIGTEDELTAGQIKAADAIILAIDTAITGAGRFEGKKAVEAPTNVCVKTPKQLIQKIEAELDK